MRKLHTEKPDVQREKSPLRRYAPLAAGLALCAGFFALSGGAGAEQSRRDRCTATLHSGDASSLSSTSRSGTTLNVPLLDDTHLKVLLPKRYMDGLVEAARARPEAERRDFIIGVVQDNVELAVSGRGSQRTYTFECAAIPAAPAATAPSGSARPAEADGGAPQPAPADAGTEAAPQPAPPAGSDGRRHTIQPTLMPPEGGKSSGPNASAPAGKTSLPPLPRQITGGKGTAKNPYVVVPAIGRQSSGTGGTVFQVPLHFDVDGAGTVHFKLSVTLSQLGKKARAQTNGELQGVFREVMTRKGLETNNRPPDSTALKTMRQNFSRSFHAIASRAAERDEAFARYIDAN